MSKTALAIVAVAASPFLCLFVLWIWFPLFLDDYEALEPVDATVSVNGHDDPNSHVWRERWTVAQAGAIKSVELLLIEFDSPRVYGRRIVAIDKVSGIAGFVECETERCQSVVFGRTYRARDDGFVALRQVFGFDPPHWLYVDDSMTVLSLGGTSPVNIDVRIGPSSM